MRQDYLRKKGALMKVAIDSYHSTVRKQHDFVNALIISGANQDLKCADRDVADCAISVTNEFNEHVDLPNMYFNAVAFTADMRLAYEFQMYVEEHDGCIDLVYVDGNISAEENLNWGFSLSDIAEEWLEKDLDELAESIKSQGVATTKVNMSALQDGIKKHCEQVMQGVVRKAGSASNVVNQFVCIPDENGNHDDMLDLYFIREEIEAQLNTPELKFELGSLSLSADAQLQYWLLVDIGDAEEVGHIGRAGVESVGGLAKINWEYINKQLVEEADDYEQQ